GVIWSVFWWKWYRDDPRDHSGTTREELQTILEGIEQEHSTTIRWRGLFSRNLLMICLMYFCVGYAFYFYLTWLPTYLKEARGFTTQQSGIVAGLILFAGGVATAIGGRRPRFFFWGCGVKICRGVRVFFARPNG